MRGRRSPLPAAALLLALAAPACAPDGAKLLESEGCLTCHRFQGRGGYMGPDLTAVTARLEAEEIAAKITQPSKNDPAARMPPFRHLTKREVRAIIHYLGE